MEDVKKEKIEMLDSYNLVFSSISAFKILAEDIKQDLDSLKSELLGISAGLTSLYTKEKDDAIASKFRNFLDELEEIEDSIDDVSRKIDDIIDDTDKIKTELNEIYKKKLNEII